MPSHIFSVNYVLCPVRAEFLQLVFSWASDEIQLQGFGGWSNPLAFITGCHFGLKVDYWRKLMQSYRFMKFCLTAHSFYGKSFHRPPCSDRGIILSLSLVCRGLSAVQPSPSQGEHQCSTNHKTLEGSVIHHEKQNFSSMQLQFMLGEEKTFLIKP